MVACPVLIPGWKFLFLGTGWEIRNCIPGFREVKGNGIFQWEGKENLMLVFPGNGNSLSPLAQRHKLRINFFFKWRGNFWDAKIIVWF